MRFLPIGAHAVLVELAGLEETLALFATLERDPLPQIAQIVPGARTLLISFHHHDMPDLARFAADLRGRDLSQYRAKPARDITIPVLYDGEDLDEVARLTGMEPSEVIARHAASTFTVAFTGFAPGFAYLQGGDPALFVPRRRSPRPKIPAGAVALAGEFSGVYPKASPGGWQIIGTTPLEMFDLNRTPSALLQPGTRVRFEPLPDRAAFDRLRPQPSPSSPKRNDFEGTTLTVTACPMPALWQDEGRFGQARQGMSASGARDRASFHEANAIVGNAANMPCLEITGSGFAFSAHGPAVIAVTGAIEAIHITSAHGQRIKARPHMPLALDAGDQVRLSAGTNGVCSYLAARGGFSVETILGSSATDTLAGIGPKAVETGSILAIRPRSGGNAVNIDQTPPSRLPAAGEIVDLDITFGPRTSWFTPGAIAHLTDTKWLVTPQSNRVGLRLENETALDRVEPNRELPSEGTIRGAIQIPHNGQPIVFLADHPLTIGYPVIASIAEHHLDLAGQIPAGAFIRFRALAPYSEIAPITGPAS